MHAPPTAPRTPAKVSSAAQVPPGLGPMPGAPKELAERVASGRGRRRRPRPRGAAALPEVSHRVRVRDELSLQALHERERPRCAGLRRPPLELR